MLAKDGAELTNSLDIANCLNDAFYSVFTKPRQGLLPEFRTRSSQVCEPNDTFINKPTVKSILINLNPLKSTGVDMVHPRVLKDCAESLSGPILTQS
jgi:hypothetical protein